MNDKIEILQVTNQWPLLTYHIGTNATWSVQVPPGFAAEIERLQACERALEIAETALRAHEAWEADIIFNADWTRDTPRLTQAQCDALPDVQGLRNAALTAIAATSHEAEQAAPQGEVRE